MPAIFGPSFFIIWVLVAVVFVIAFRKGDGAWKKGVVRGFEMFIVNGPRIICALLAAGFPAYILPRELIATWLGEGSGWRGILIGCAVGPFFPGGPLVIFPVVVALLKSGAGIPAVIAFLTSGSVWGLHRIFMFEVPMMGTRFAVTRFVASALLPPLSGLFAALLIEFLGTPSLIQ
jgi:uncharacterized membrane protein YraQ (UPF0718 family)